MLWVPADAAPRREPFLVVDEKLVVQAISRYAEAVLTVDEPAAVAAPLDRFLIPDQDRDDTDELARLVGLAAAGTPSDDSLQMLTAHETPTRFSVRVTSCGPPLAAMVILVPGAGSGAETARRPSRRPAKRSGRGRAANGHTQQSEAKRVRRSGGGAGPTKTGGDASTKAGRDASTNAGDAIPTNAGGASQTRAGRAAARTRRPGTAEETLTGVAGRLIVSGQRLARERRDIRAGLGAIARLRGELEQAERELVELARRGGLSWAEIGAELNIIGPGAPGPDVPA
ncbi:MAG TPA: hypothetical protein VGI87_09230 [Solirubrobacteraceae bacterium]|jgi:hypothetical protein